MFDIGFSELGVIGVVALVVLGPERLPKVARAAGQWVGKMQRYVSEVKADINREADLAALREMQQSVQNAASDIESELSDNLHTVHDALESESRPADYYDRPLSLAPLPLRKKKFRSRQTAVPLWYRRQHGLRSYVQSGAARMKRHKKY